MPSIEVMGSNSQEMEECMDANMESLDETSTQMQEFVDLCSDPTFAIQLKNAVEHPNSAKGKELKRKISPLIEKGNGKSIAPAYGVGDADPNNGLRIFVLFVFCKWILLQIRKHCCIWR